MSTQDAVHDLLHDCAARLEADVHEAQFITQRAVLDRQKAARAFAAIERKAIIAQMALRTQEQNDERRTPCGVSAGDLAPAAPAE